MKQPSDYFNDQPETGRSGFPKDICWMRKLAWWMDEAITIPGLKQNIGLDPILGLLPGLGDGVSALAALYPLWLVVKYQLPKWLLLKMVINTVIDTFMGAIPLLGDLFDAGWKSNTKNADLLENAYRDKYPQRYAGDPSEQVIDITAR